MNQAIYGIVYDAPNEETLRAIKEATVQSLEVSGGTTRIVNGKLTVIGPCSLVVQSNTRRELSADEEFQLDLQLSLPEEPSE